MNEKEYRNIVDRTARLAELQEALARTKALFVDDADYEKAAKVRDWLEESEEAIKALTRASDPHA